MHLPDPAAIGAALQALFQETAAPAARAAEAAASQPTAAERSLHFLAYAYIVVWVILAGYLLTLSVRLRTLSRKVQRLKERLQG